MFDPIVKVKGMSDELRDFMINSIVDFLRNRKNVKSLGKTWLKVMTDEELKQKYDEVVNEV